MARCCATWKSCRTRPAPRPTYNSTKLDAAHAKTGHVFPHCCISCDNARTNNVFPDPGGPCNNIPRVMLAPYF